MASIRRVWAHHSTPCIGYRALSVDFSENGKFGKNGIDMVLARADHGGDLSLVEVIASKDLCDVE